jgi:diguanylate cyclase (GGDEF)-like protein
MSALATGFFTPVLCVLLALLLCWQQSAFGPDLRALLPVLPYILLSIASLIALLSNHSRELALSLLMLGAYWLIRSTLQAPLSSVPAAQIFYLLTVSLPIIGTAYLFIPETGLLHPLGILVALLPVALLMGLGQLFMAHPELGAELSRASQQNHLSSMHISAGALGLYALSCSCAGLMLFLKHQSTPSSVLGCLLALFVLLSWIHIENISATMFIGIGLLLTITITSALFHIGFYDELTQIGNRRALHAAVKTAGNQYTLAIVDADHFKKINDRFGHDLGDQALKVIASCISKTGCGAKAFRYGGEEFCLLFKGKTRDQVADCLEQLRQVIANYDMVIRDKKHRPTKQAAGEKKRGASKRHSNLRLTVSVGVADNSKGGSFDHLIKLADRAL